MAERDMVDRMRETYMLATEQASACATVSIHVGPDVWLWLRERAIAPTPENAAQTLFGFQILHEAAWEPDRLEVRTTRVIP